MLFDYPTFNPAPYLYDKLTLTDADVETYV